MLRAAESSRSGELAGMKQFYHGGEYMEKGRNV
jgi:hypothetical protein